MLFVESRLLVGHDGFAVLQPRLAVVLPRPLLRLSRQGRFPNLNLRIQYFAPAVQTKIRNRRVPLLSPSLLAAVYRLLARLLVAL